jgi:protein SCO1/2
MKKIIKTTAIVSLILVLFSCQTKEKKGCCKKDKTIEAKNEFKEISDESVFQLESKWIKQSNDSIFLRDLEGKIIVTAMVFTHCESACPRIVADLQRIEKAFNKEELENIQFLLISMDPKRDTPQRFLTFAKEHSLNKNWLFISSSEDATMEIANVLNVRFKKLSDGGYDHSNIIHVLDRNGKINFQQNGLEQKPDDLIANIKKLLQ